MSKGFSRVEMFCVLAGAIMSVLILASPLTRVSGPFFSSGAAAAMVLALFVFVMVIWIAGQDLATMTIPDGPLIAIALVGAAVRVAQSADEPAMVALSAILDALLCGGALLAVREVFFRLRGIDGLGFGDVKLAAASAVLIGTTAFFWALFLASLAGIIFAVGAGVLKQSRRLDRLAFGALLAPACWCAWIWGLWGGAQ